jgi:prolyl oligopeptidase PreP (S9A serine peptidase family)
MRAGPATRPRITWPAHPKLSTTASLPGGELGRGWHAGGCRQHRPAALADLLACMRALLRAGVAAPGRVAGHAVSAGACAQLRPAPARRRPHGSAAR